MGMLGGPEPPLHLARTLLPPGAGGEGEEPPPRTQQLPEKLEKQSREFQVHQSQREGTQSGRAVSWEQQGPAAELSHVQ